MVKIEVSKETRKLINDNHSEYIRLTSVDKLEKEIEIKKGSSRYCFLESLFGRMPQSRETCMINYCLSANLKDELKKFDNAFFKVYGFNFNDTSTEDHANVINSTRDDLDSILNYDGFNAGRKLNTNKKWSRHKFITSLGVKVCPYCNRQYITSYEDKPDDRRTTADADHYYPKAEYPILQMNIFNLVPSCNVCNSRTKGTDDKRHLYPYEDPNDSLIFKVPLEVGSQVSEILIDTKGNEKAEASKDVFKLHAIYQSHLAEASEVKNDVMIYFEFGNNAYEALQGLNVPFDIFSTWFSFVGKDISTEPLLKLRQDIFNQLKIEHKK